MGRILVLMLALGLVVAPATVVGAGETSQEDVFVRRDDDGAEVATFDDDGDGDDGDSNDRSGDSNDRTGSGHSAVSRDRDRSRGDLTRDRTKDGPGDSKRDWTGGSTNDRTRNDTR